MKQKGLEALSYSGHTYEGNVSWRNTKRTNMKTGTLAATLLRSTTLQRWAYPKLKIIPIRVCFRTQDILSLSSIIPNLTSLTKSVSSPSSFSSIRSQHLTLIIVQSGRKTLNSIRLTMTTAAVPSTIIIGKPDVHHEWAASGEAKPRPAKTGFYLEPE